MCHAPDVHLIRITARGRPFPTLATQEGSMAQYETTCVQYCHHLAAIIMVSLSPKNVQKFLLNTFQVLSGDWKFTQPSEHCLHCTLTKQGRQHTTPYTYSHMRCMGSDFRQGTCTYKAHAAAHGLTYTELSTEVLLYKHKQTVTITRNLL